MHIANILSRLAGKDLESSDQLIPISFNVHTRSTRPLMPSHRVLIPGITTMTKVFTPKPTHTKTKMPHMHIPKTPQPPQVPPYAAKSSIKTPPVPVGILQKSFPPKPPPSQKEVRKSLVNPNLKIPKL